MNPADLQILKDEISKSIKETVNGKIDRLTADVAAHNKKHEGHMNRIMPVLEAYEASEKFAKDAKNSGIKAAKVLIWIGTFVTTVGGAWLVFKQIITIPHP